MSTVPGREHIEDVFKLKRLRRGTYLRLAEKNDASNYTGTMTKNELRSFKRLLKFGFLITIAFVIFVWLRLTSRPGHKVNAGKLAGLLLHQSVEITTGELTTFQHRRRHVGHSCQKLHFTGDVHEITGSKEYNISVCIVQKAGCTQWHRLFKYLAGQKKTSDGPIALSKYEIYNQQGNLFTRFDLHGRDKDFINQSLRVMTVRHPFTRLWSAYIDKLVLPDFWQRKGKQILKMVRKNTTKEASNCGNDVTFTEFVEYVLRTGISRQDINVDNHWLPASYLCNPCQFIPDIIQKQETLVEDFRYTLENSGLSHYFNNMFSQSPNEFEIREEIEYVFKKAHEIKTCASKYQLLQVIWKAFILNGYIPPNEPFPTEISSNISIDAFYNCITNVRKRTNMTSTQSRYFREVARREAYSSLTSQQIAGLKRLYEMDILLFEYSEST